MWLFAISDAAFTLWKTSWRRSESQKGTKILFFGTFSTNPPESYPTPVTTKTAIEVNTMSTVSMHEPIFVIFFITVSRRSDMSKMTKISIWVPFLGGSGLTLPLHGALTLLHPQTLGFTHSSDPPLSFKGREVNFNYLGGIWKIKKGGGNMVHGQVFLNRGG